MINFIKVKKYWVILIILALVVGGYFIYKNKSQSSATQYTTSGVTKGTIVSSISASGSVSSSNFYSVKTTNSGIITGIFIKDGDTVTKGQKLLQFTMDSIGQQNYNKAYAAYLSAQTAYDNAVSNKTILGNNLDQANSSVNQQKLNAQKTLNSAKSGLAQAQNDYAHASNTLTRKTTKLALDSAIKTLEVAQMQYDAIGTSSDQNQTSVVSAENKLAQADSAITQAQTNLYSAKLDYQDAGAVVYAPIDGQISGLSVFEGMTISGTTTSSSNSNSTSSATTQLLSIANQSNPLVAVNVSESDINKIKVDKRATISLDAISDKTFTGKVVGINKMGSVSSNVTNYPVTIQFDTQSNEILPNMSATVNIILDSKTDVLVVPSAAVTTDANGQSSVQVMINGRPQNRDVQIGLSSDTDIEIVSGLTNGDVAVTGTVAKTTTSTSGSTSSVFGGIRTGAAGGAGLGSSGSSNVRVRKGN